MAKLSLSGSQALSAVAEVAHDVAEAWLAGHRSVPHEIVVMLRGLASIQSAREARRR